MVIFLNLLIYQNILFIIFIWVKNNLLNRDNCIKAFWNYPSELDKKRTITELIGVPDEINDGIYLLNLSMANIENDASPSRPTIYKLF